MTFDVPHYFPPFLWKIWLSDRGGCDLIHSYDVYSNELSDIVSNPTDHVSFRPIFHGLDDPCHLAGTLQALQKAERRFHSLQSQAEQVLHVIVDSLYASADRQASISSIQIDQSHLASLMKFFVFLRFRNSVKYRQIVHGLMEDQVLNVHSGSNQWCCSPNLATAKLPSKRSAQLSELYGPLWRQVRCQAVLNSFAKFFEMELPSAAYPTAMVEAEWHKQTTKDAASTHLWNRQGVPPKDPFLDVIRTHLWGFCQNAEICLGMSEDQEFILPDSWFGILDEAFGWAGEEENPSKECLDSFFPILPSLALYVIGDVGSRSNQRAQQYRVTIEVGLEQPSDIHLRNAMILSAIPQSGSTGHSNSSAHSHGPKLYFSSLSSIARSISSYDEFRCRWIPDQFYDYSRLKQRCRQRFLQESVTKMLFIKGEVRVFDLTDQVEFLSTEPVACGAFSDVWQGNWWDGVESKQRVVAIKFLRQVMVQNVREKLFKRLEAEVVTWHRLCHLNVASFFGVVSNSHSIGMVSEWCVNGTVEAYLKEKKPEADRMSLLIQIASGVTYLHNVKPPVVHGDLKGGNILIDAHGRPIITDFGLSKVIEDLSTTVPELLGSSPLTAVPELLLSSSFGGSARWMAPELVGCLLEDRIPRVTTESDVWAFGCICLEITTGQVPYPQRTNNASVTMDISRGVKPSRGSPLLRSCLDILRLSEAKASDFVAFLDSCWDSRPPCRPTMAGAWKTLGLF